MTRSPATSGGCRPSPVVSELERCVRQIVFLGRVSLEDLSLVHPEADACATKEEFLEPYLRSLRALVVVALEHAPAEVSRIFKDFPEIRCLLPQDWTEGRDTP